MLFHCQVGSLGHRVILHSIDPISPTERQPQALLRATCEPWTTPKTSCQFFNCNGTRLPTGSGHAREAVLRGGGARNQRCPCGVGGSMRGRGARWEISIRPFRPFRPCRFWNLL